MKAADALAAMVEPMVGANGVVVVVVECTGALSCTSSSAVTEAAVAVESGRHPSRRKSPNASGRSPNIALDMVVEVAVG